jgi:trk system potassium uptake protein TrkH
MGGLIKLVRQMAKFTIVTELIGAALFLIHFAGEMPFGKAVWVSVFQSISAFNNAGFDLFGSFHSLSAYQGTPLVLLVTAALVILGGISFIVLADIHQKRSWPRLSLDSKLILSITAALLLLGLAEFNDPDALGAMSVPQRILNAFFQSVSARTAGFSTVNMANLADYALFFTMLLMFIGGASGSTAGGIKVNTFGMIIGTIWSTIRGREYPGAFGREFSMQQINRALTVIIMSMGFIGLAVFVLTLIESIGFLDLLFETFSAFGTVGLSTGITPQLSAAGRIIITIVMFIGRLGPLALMLALIQRQKASAYRYPGEAIRIG